MLSIKVGSSNNYNELLIQKSIWDFLKGVFIISAAMLIEAQKKIAYWKKLALDAEKHPESSATNVWTSNSVSRDWKKEECIEIDQDQREAMGQAGVHLVSVGNFVYNNCHPLTCNGCM